MLSLRIRVTWDSPLPCVWRLDHVEFVERLVESFTGLSMGEGTYAVVPEKPLEEAGEINE